MPGLIVTSENPLRLTCWIYNRDYEDGTADKRFRTKRENLLELWADEAFELYGFGLDHFGIVEHNVWKEHVLTGATDRLEEFGLPGPSRHIGDDSSLKAWGNSSGKKGALMRRSSKSSEIDCSG